MQVKKEEFRAIQRLYWIMTAGQHAIDDIKKHSGKTKQEVIDEAGVVLSDVWQRYLKDNKRTAEYCAKQRTVNKDFARGKGVKAIKFTDEQH